MLASWKASPGRRRGRACPRLRGNAHHYRHHHPDRAGHVVAIAQQVGLAARHPVGGVEFEAGDHIVGHGAGDPGFARERPKRVERGIAEGSCPAKASAVSLADLARRSCAPTWSPSAPPMSCASAMIVAGPAPGIEQPHPLARHPVEQGAGRSEAFRAALDEDARGQGIPLRSSRFSRLFVIASGAKRSRVSRGAVDCRVASGSSQ
jgi:hypothetical protein